MVKKEALTEKKLGDGPQEEEFDDELFDGLDSMSE